MDVFRKKLVGSLFIRLTRYCLIFQLIFPPFWLNAVYAALVTDPNANVQFQPRIDSTYAVPVINIVAPNNSGLSHNKYQYFDITEDGAVFNNSLVTGNSRLAGQVIANPLFGGRTASIILNEVTGASESELKGLMEVFGDKANLIIANPNGITCNGCGFINTQRATLTTGTPDFSADKLKFDVDGGLIRFEGEGHSYRSFIDEMDVLAQYIDVNGDISTKNRLSLVAGRFIFDYSKSIAGGSLTEWVEPKKYDATKSAGRALAIDGTIFGAIQSGQIDIMGTEQGLGVKVDGYLFAQADDLFIQSAGGLSVHNADAVREITLSAQGDIEIGADLIANLAIKTQGETISTSEETNLIANEIDLNAEKSIYLKGEIKTLELEVTAESIVSEADLLAINSLAITASKEANLKQSTLGTKQSNIEANELKISDTSFNISVFNVTAAKLLVENATIDVESLNFDLGEIDSNNLKLFANEAVINYDNWSDTESQWNITDLYLAGKQLETQDSSWLISKGDLNVSDLSLADSTLFSYETQITANNINSRDSKYYAEKLTLNIAETLSSIDDHWKILPFSDQTEVTDAGSFNITADKIQLSGSIVQTDKYEQQAKETVFTNTGIAANTLDIKTDTLLTDADTLWIANNRIDIAAQQAQLNGTIKTTNINLASENSELSGQWLVSDTATIDVEKALNLNNIGVSAQALITSFETGTWDNLIVKTQNSNVSASNNLILIKATLESETLIIDAEQLQTDTDSWLGANEMRIDSDVLTNNGILLAASELELNSRQIDNSGEIASFEAININNEETLTNEGRIIANDLLISTNELINNKSIGSQNLELVYQNVTNSSEAVLSSQNAVYKAKTNTASFTNYGTQIASDSMSWLTLEDSSGSYINAGILSGTQVNFTGLTTVQNGLLIDGNIKGTIQALTNSDNNIEGTLTIGAEEFTQLGTLEANQVSIIRNDFHNEGAIYSDQFTANTTAEFINSGVIGAQTIDITTTKLTNNVSSTISATNTNISNANIINAGELISNEFNIIGSAAGGNDVTNTFTNTESGVVVQNARFEQLDDDTVQLVSLGSASISGFDTFTNSGLIETDGLLSIANIKAFNNLEDNLTDLDNATRINSKSGIKLENIDSVNNEAIIVANAIAIDAYSINNSGILGAGEAAINITTADTKTGQLTNSGKIYQSDLIAAETTRDSLSTIQNQFNINTTNLDNLSAAAIEIKQGSINLNNGDLRNLGLISEVEDANDDSSLSLSGIRNLENYNDISISTDLHIEENGSLRNLGKDSYINANSLTGGSITNRLSKLENEGSLLIQKQVDVYVDSVANDSEARLLAKGISIDSSNSVSNKGLIGAENDLNITSKILINALLSELYSAEGKVSLTADAELNNAGRILAKQDINLESNALINSGLMSAEKSLLINQKTAGSLTNDGLMIGENLLVGNNLFRQKALRNNGKQTQDVDGNVIYQGLQSTSGNVQITTEVLGNSGSIISANNLVINATDDMTGEFAMSGQLEAAQQLTLTGTSLTLTNTGRINASGSEHQIELSETLNNDGVIALASSAAINTHQILNSGIIQSDQLQLQAVSSINNQGSNSTIFANTLALTGASISNDGLIHGNESLLLNVINAVNNTQGAKLTSLGILQIRDNNIAESILAVSNSGIINANGLSIDSKSLSNQHEAIIAAGEARLSITNLVNEGTVYQTDDLVIAEERGLLASSEGAFNITANAINNIGLQSSIDIKNGVVDVRDLTNEGSLREREAGANSSDSLLLSNVKSLDNSGEIVLYSDLLLNNSSIKNTGTNAYLRANSITADSVVAFENSGKIASKNDFSLNTANDFTNSGEIIASDLQISSDKKISNNKLLQAENNITLNASAINNTSSGEISTTSADSVLILNGTSAITNDGLLASRGDITINTQALTNNKNISASKTTVLNVGSLGNSGLIYGENLIVGSAGNQFKNIAQPSGVRTFSSVEQKGLVAANSLTLYTQGILNDVYQAANINISSDSALTLNGSLVANNQANITSTNFTNNGKVDIGDSALTSTWDVQGTLTNNGIINSKSNLLLNADTTSNDGALNTTKALTINTKTFTNKSNGSLSSKGQLTISGIGQSLTDRSTSFTNAGTIVTDQGFDLSANSIVNSNKIEVTGNSQWYFNSLSNTQGSRISVDGDWKLGSTNHTGSITNYGKLYAANIDFYGTSLYNRDQFVAYDRDLNIDLTSSLSNYGSLYAKNAFNIKTTYDINNNGTIESFNVANNSLNARTINNGNGSSITGSIKTQGDLTITADTLNNKSYNVGEKQRKGIVLNYTLDTGDDSHYQLDFIDVSYYEKAQSSINVQGSLTGKGRSVGSGTWNNLSSTISADYINIAGLNDVNNETQTTESVEIFVRWHHDTKTGGNKKHREAVHKKYNAMSYEELAQQIDIRDDGYYWNVLETGLAKNEDYIVLNANPDVTLEDRNVAIIHARKGLTVGSHTNITNTGSITAPEIGPKGLEDNASANNIAVTNTNSSDGTTTTNGSGVTGSSADETTIGDNTDNQNTNVASAESGESESTEALDETDDHIKGSFINGADGIIINVANRQPTATISLLSFIIPGLSFDALNAASVAGDKTPEELAAQTALQAQLNGLDSDKQNNSKSIQGQSDSYNAQAPSLFDLDADILARIIADTEYELSPEYIFDKVDPDRALDTEPSFFLDPYQEAQAVTQAALQQTGTAFFSPDWNTSAEQRKGLYDNTVAYLVKQQGVTLGKALTPMQVKQLEQPMIWYVAMDIGGKSQLVPTVYLPEATLESITTPSAGTLIADNIDLDVGTFKNTGNITATNSARIKADEITNQRNVMTFGDDRNYGAIVGTGGNISAGDLSLISKTDINNNGGSLTAEENLLLDAKGDIFLNALELKQRSQNGKNVTESTDYLLSQLNAGGDATFKAGGDINSQAAQAKIGGNGIFDATNINLLGVTERDYSKTVTKKKDTFSSSKKTVETEQLNFVGSDFQVNGNMIMNAENDITMVGANIDVGKSAAITAGNDITLTAGISTDTYSKDKSGSGTVTTSSQQKGHITETATGTLIKTGESLQIDSDGGNVAILASELNAQENLVLGDMNIKRDENGAPIKDDNGQYITEDGSSINNLTIGTVELKDESWNNKTSGLKGPLKDLAAVAAFTLSASGLGQVAMAAGVDTEIEVGSSSESRIETTTHATSTVTAGNNLYLRTDGETRIEGSQVNVGQDALIETGSTVITAVENTTTTTESESTHTVGATQVALKEDEVTVAGVTETKHTETTTTTDTELVKAGLNVGGNLAMNSVENIDVLASDVNVEGDSTVKAKTITVAGLKEQATTEHTEKTETTTTSVGVKNAYVDTALALQAVVEAGAAVDAAKSDLDKAKRQIKNGELQANAIDDYKANLAAATTQLTQATLSAGASAAVAAGTTGTGGFYATGSAEKTTTEKSSTNTEERYIGSNFNVGGDASFDADSENGSIDIIGSNMDIAGGLALNAKDINIKAGTEETTSTSSETTRTAGASYSTNGSGSVNASGSNTDADSYSKTHINSTINAGSLTSSSDNLTLSGANVEIAGGIDIDTGNLTIESLQDESSSNSNTEGYTAGMGFSPSSMDPSAIGANENSSKANSQWVNNQTTLIGGAGGEGEVNISADKTTITGAVLASATRNEDGSLTDNNSLNLATDELIIEDIKDKDHSENEGFDVSAGLSSSGSSSVGLTSDGHKKEQTNLATIGGGNITKKDGSAHEEELVASANSDLNNSQEITKDMKTGGLNATVVVDHRLVTEGGRETIANNFEDSYEHGEDIARAVDTIIESDDLGILNAGEGIHNNAMATQLKNDLVRNPENAHILEGLQSENPEEYNAATQALGKLAQEKFGLEASEINLYDGDETTSGTLANNALGDVAGGVVIDEANSEYGNIFIDAGDGATKTDMANTLGHEVLETQALQGKDGGVFGNNSEQTQEAMSNSFGEQFADRIDQAAGGDLNSTGGATFSSDLKNSNAVATGTQNANKVGNATVDHRQLYVAEAKAIIDAAPAYAEKHKISEAQAKKELTQQALLQVDKEWSEQKHIVENERARDELAGISATKPPAKDGYVEGGEVGLFIATPDDYNNPYINANQASRIEDGAAGEKGFLTTNATANGTLPIELTPMEVVSETASGALIGIKNAGEALIDDFPSAMQSAASAVADTVSGCLDQGCIGSDPREGFNGDRAHVDLLQGDKESAIGNNASAMAGELLPAATVVNQTGRVIGGVAETIKDGLDNKLTSSDTTSSSLGQVDVDGEVIEQAGKSTDLSDVKPEANFSNINDPENTFRGPNSPEVLRADVDHSQQTGSRVTDPNRGMPLVTESTAEAGSKGANLNTRKEFHDQRVVDAQQEIKSHGADTTSEVMVVSSNGEKARLDIAIAGTPNQSIPVPKGMIAEDRHGVPLPVQEIKLDNQGLAIAEVKTGKAKPERQQPECLAACEAGTATVRGEKIKRLDLEVGDKAPESVVVLRDPRDPVKDK